MWARGPGVGRPQSQGSLEAFLEAMAEQENFRVDLASTIRAGVALDERGPWSPSPHLSLAQLQVGSPPGLPLGYHQPGQKALPLPHNVSAFEERTAFEKILHLGPGSRPRASPKPGPLSSLPQACCLQLGKSF